METIRENPKDEKLSEIKEKFPNILEYLYGLLKELELELQELLRLENSPAYWYNDEKIEKSKKRVYRRVNKIYFFIDMIKEL